MIKLLVILLSLFLPSVALAGGTVPEAMGQFKDGRMVDIVPASKTIRWTYYGNAVTPEVADILVLSTAGVDAETTEFSLRFGEPLEPARPVQVWISVRSDALPPECADTPGSGTECLLAETVCLTSVKQGAYKYCSAYRITVHASRISHIKPLHEALPGILRHEWGHVMGLSHIGGTPMVGKNEWPFTACHKALWGLFTFNSGTEWIVVPNPESCL